MSTRSVAVVLLYGCAYAGFSLLLHAGGHRPSFGALVHDHYLLQAVLLIPGTFAGWYLFGLIARSVAGGTASLREIRDAIAPTLFVPLLLLFVIPDIAVYLALGFDALARTMRYYAPLAFLASFLLTVRAVHRASGVSWLRSGGATALAYLAFMIFTSAWLR